MDYGKRTLEGYVVTLSKEVTSVGTAGESHQQTWCPVIMMMMSDLVASYRNCQADPTCVQCDSCFQRSDHTGHDVRPNSLLHASGISFDTC